MYGHGTHTVQGVEVYNGKPILYAIGHSAFDQPGYEDSKDGLVVRVVIEGKRIRRVSFVPVTRNAKNDVMMVDPSSGGRRAGQRNQTPFGRWAVENRRSRGRPAGRAGTVIQEIGRDQASGMITHPEKVLFPDDGITKGELAGYYEAIAPVMVPHIRGRPITMERYPAGIDGKGFWRKDVSKGFPDWLERIEVPKKDGTVHHPLVTDTRSLLWVTNQNTITQHVWTSRAPNLYQPDVCVFDLDPSREDEPEVLRTVALALRDLLAELGLSSWVKTQAPRGSTYSCR